MEYTPGSIGEASAACLSCTDIVFQAPQRTHHVVLVQDGGVGDAGAGTQTQLELAKARVAAFIAHERIQLLMVDVPARNTHIRRHSSICCNFDVKVVIEDLIILN